MITRVSMAQHKSKVLNTPVPSWHLYTGKAPCAAVLIFCSFCGAVSNSCRNANLGFYRMLDLSFKIMRALKTMYQRKPSNIASIVPSLQWLAHIWEGFFRCGFTQKWVDKLDSPFIVAGDSDPLGTKFGAGQCCTFQALDHFCFFRILD